MVGSKWVFRLKKDAKGQVVRLKARLVAQGFSQVPGVDYFDTFALVSRLSSIRTVLMMAAADNLELHQIDIKGAYLNGELTDNKVIYMRQPPGYAEGQSVCHLCKPLYGLKQSGRHWYQKLVNIMLKLGFKHYKVDQAVFYRCNKERGVLIIVLVHVDDCSIATLTSLLIDRFKHEITTHMDITDMGELRWILGMEVMCICEERRILLCQRSYIDSIVRRYGFEDLKPISTPMDPQLKLSTAQSPNSAEDIAKMRHISYHEAIGSLMYASLGSQPDITFAVQTLFWFSTNPGPIHWDAVKHVFRYLKGTCTLWLLYEGGDIDLTGYADADGSMMEERRAVSGYTFLLNGGAVSWGSKKQKLSRSQQWRVNTSPLPTQQKKRFGSEVSFRNCSTSSCPQPPFSLTTNQQSPSLKNQYHARTKHIDIRYHFICWVIEDGKLRLIYCPTNEMATDVLTKALPSPKVKHFASALSLVTI